MKTAYISVSSMSATQFWHTLKSEADAVSWNLRDVQRNEVTDGTKLSLGRAIESAERMTMLISDRMEDFKRRMTSTRAFNENSNRSR